MDFMGTKYGFINGFIGISMDFMGFNQFGRYIPFS